MLVGRLTKMPELKEVKDKKVCEFTIATNRINGQDADFINCVAWNSQAENLCKYQVKGNIIGVIGELRIDSYEIEGNKRYKTYVMVNNIEFLESKKEKTNPFEEFGNSIKTEVQEQLEISEDEYPF
jgi:single-strand DNA-binding protein